MPLRQPIQPLNPRVRRAFPRILPRAVPAMPNLEADQIAAMLAAFQGLYGEPEIPLEDAVMRRVMQQAPRVNLNPAAPRMPIEEYDELGTMPDEVRGVAPGGRARKLARRAINMRSPAPPPPVRRRGLRYFGG